jgi:hypothetical protein
MTIAGIETTGTGETTPMCRRYLMKHLSPASATSDLQQARA